MEGDWHCYKMTLMHLLAYSQPSSYIPVITCEHYYHEKPQLLRSPLISHAGEISDFSIHFSQLMEV